MMPNNESVVGKTTPWPMPISGPSLQNPKDRLGSVPYLFAPLPTVATFNTSFFCLPLLTGSLRTGDRTWLRAQVVTLPQV